jgi:hypothetical protein
MPHKIIHVFVDESGDPFLFGRKKIDLTESSPIFMIGVLCLDNPDEARQIITTLREEILRDNYLNKICSVTPEAKKTALMFHAKDDAAEVRYLVYKTLTSIPAKVTVLVRRKSALQEHARSTFEQTGKKLTENELYDSIVVKLFEHISHKDIEYQVKFATRGKRERNAAMQSAIENSKLNLIDMGRNSDARFTITSEYSQADPCLQIIDYYLWALYRLYVKSEERYFDFVKDRFNVILDADDSRNNPEGELYTRHNKLELIKLMPVNS